MFQRLIVASLISATQVILCGLNFLRIFVMEHMLQSSCGVDAPAVES